MNKDEQRIIFLKKRILNRLEEMQEYMSSTKYKLYKTMVNDCNSFDEIREIAELDMQLGFIDYVIKLKHSLDENNISIDNIEDISNYNDKSQQLSLIIPSKNIKTTHKLDDIDISTLGEDIEDEEVLAAASSILLSRLNAMPPEELYREQLENYEEDELSEEYIDDIHVSYDDLYDNSEDTDEEDADEEDIDIEDVDDDFFIDEEDTEDDEEDELDFDDIDESELGIDDEEKQDINDIVPDFSNETDDEEDELDFGNNESNDIDNISDDDIFIDNDEESDDESDDTDWDSLGDDLFEEEDDNFDDDYSDDESDEEDDDIDSLGDDLFEEEDDNFDDDSNNESDEESDEDDIDSLGDDLFKEDDDDDSFDDYSDDESDEDDINSIDNIDADDLFCDDDSEDVDDDSEEDDTLSDIDNIEDDSDEFDLDDTDFEYDEPTDDAESFDDFFKSKNVNDINNKKKKRDATPQKVFINGSKRGKQTQDMFNILNNMFGGFGRAGSKLGNTFKNSIKAGVNKVNKSSFFNLSGQ